MAVGRWPLAVGLVLFGPSAPFVRADEWVASFTVTNDKHHSNYGNYSYPDELVSADDGRYYQGGGKVGWGGSNHASNYHGGTATANFSFTITPKLTWQGTSTPPDRAAVLLGHYFFGLSRTEGEGNLPAITAESTRLIAPSNFPPVVAVPYPVVAVPYESGYKLNLQGRLLLNKDNPTRASEVTFAPMNFSMLHNVPSNPGTFAYVNSEASINLTPDTRTVKLSRGGRHERIVLEGGEWHAYGDSIYSAKGNIDPLADKRVPLDIQATYEGSWNTKVLTWVPKGFAPIAGVVTYEQDENGARGTTVFGVPQVSLQPVTPTFSYHNYHPSSSTGAQEFVSTLTVTDTDGAVAKAHYHLELHDPVELLDEGESITNYQIEKPYTNGGNVLGWTGLRDANSATIEITNETSIETGIGVKATASIDALKDLLGLSAEANHTSTHKFTITTKTEVPKDIPETKYRYLIAVHNFTRKHKRFYRFDESGEIRRMVEVDSYGNAINPPVAMYHELIEDTAQPADAKWSPIINGENLDPNTLPKTPVPPAEYDFPSGGAS